MYYRRGSTGVVGGLGVFLVQGVDPQRLGGVYERPKRSKALHQVWKRRDFFQP